MPPRLKSFELHGYKTFASRNEFVFSDGITAIVGPNGSGKSNIADALRWVLGEQSYGLLRAKKTEDMIFSGSENRPRAGMASATIVFDNSDGWLPIDFVEVGITRRAYRDGENEYLLNGQRVRLKDVSEVLAKSGLAERTYTIIGQGLVDAALALKAEERRRLFEEAAGIGLHRSRREEAFKRLDATRRNLERVQDILAELQPRLRSLERQAKRAQEYNQMKADLRLVLREWYGYHWHKAQAELVETQLVAKQQEEIFNKVHSDQVDLDQKLGSYRAQISEIRDKLNNWHLELTSLHQSRERISREQAVNNERSRSFVEQQEQVAKEISKLDEEFGLHKDQLELSQLDVARLEQELKDAQGYASESALALSARVTERSEIDEQIRILRQKINDANTLSSQLDARHTEKAKHIQRLRDAHKKAEIEHSAELVQLSSSKKSLNLALRSKTQAEDRTQQFKDELQLVQDQLAKLEAKREEQKEKISAQNTLIARIQAESSVLEEAEKNLTGHEEGAKILLQAASNKLVEGAIGALGNNLSVPEEYEFAIAAVLGEYVDSLVLNSIEHSEKALDLIESDSIRGSVFPLDAIVPSKSLQLDLAKAPVESGKILGIASKLVKTEPELQPVIDLLFGQVIVVKDRKTARAILSSHDWRKIPNLRVVTLKGEVYLASGPIVRGATAKGLLARPRQRREVKSAFEQASSDKDKLEEALTQLEIKIGKFQADEGQISEKYQQVVEQEKSVDEQIHQEELEREKIQRAIDWQSDQMARYQSDIDRETAELSSLRSDIDRLEQEAGRVKAELNAKLSVLNNLPLDEIQSQNAYWNTNVAVIDQALLDARNLVKEKLILLQQMEENQRTLKARSEQLELDAVNLQDKMVQTSTEEEQIAEKIELLGKTVEPAEIELSNLEKSHNSLLTTDAQARQLLRAAEQRYTQAKINLAHHQEAFEALQRHIEDDFGLVSFDYTDTISGAKPLPLNGMVEELPKVAELSPEIEDTIQQQKAQMRRMGAINPEAQTEYQEVKDRFEFLTSQVEDLEKAEQDIKEVITELDGLMEREFRRTFESVAQEFREIFTRLFGGGSARLELTDPENMTETGIDIEARLPGRREQGLALLSGGERSLTAAALVFALLRVSPTPFCILDEVDAMLDEANVSRFRDLLTELSDKTQFIVITHNRNTVQAANIIYGVTMGRDSASQVISLRMDELGEEFGV